MTDLERDEIGRPEPPLAAGEVATLLDFQRATLEWKCAGLDDEQLPSTAMTLAGLLMHLARVEDIWFGDVVAEAGPLEPWASMPWALEWQSSAQSTGEELRRLWSGRVEASRRVAAARLEQTGTRPSTRRTLPGVARVMPR